MPEIFANINKRISSLIGEYYTKNIICYNIVCLVDNMSCSAQEEFEDTKGR